MDSIDLNCDMGEIPEAISDGTQESLMPFLTSVNIACGGHAGDLQTMKATIEQARRWRLAIGAHPGVRVFLSLHPPLVPAGADTSALTATLSGFDLYDARLAPLSHDEVAARVVSPERFPAWGTPLGNYFELMLVPRGEPLERKDADERKIRVSPGNS